MSTELAAALIAGGVSVVVAGVTAVAAARREERRIRAELRTEFMAEEALRALLLDPRWKLRTFASIKQRVRGFDDRELRQLLIRSGALCFEAQDGAELWGLRERNRSELG